ncbi:hypothetical protein N7333_04790 [Pseudomonas sp. GD04158]|jgi:hypothetical protein|uniref:hypothetical protein n=1 Tax=Pseudomonas sp. GD04158 TaxID=2975439 RepID=UPI00244C92BC|nr:hypothetical protein [Pseudomonas sp. GD04158]MDH0095887.1 hypothetical protein [Pseudomonas sp. GD04158]
MAITIEQIMEQAQVYTDALILVSQPFAPSDAKELAEFQKQVLLELLVAFEDEAHTAGAQEAQLDMAKPLIEWHQNRLGNLGQLQKAVEGTQICLGVDDANPIVLQGAMLKGWRFALALAEQQFGKFPLSIERKAPTSDEEE